MTTLRNLIVIPKRNVTLLYQVECEYKSIDIVCDICLKLFERFIKMDITYMIISSEKYNIIANFILLVESNVCSMISILKFFTTC